MTGSKGGIMKKAIYTSILFCIMAGAYSKNFNIVNDTDLPLRITWKSNGLASESKSGVFDLLPGGHCTGCIETHHDNCVHILFIEAFDPINSQRKYKIRSKPFCDASTITISLDKRLKITFEKLEAPQESL